MIGPSTFILLENVPKIPSADQPPKFPFFAEISRMEDPLPPNFAGITALYSVTFLIEEGLKAVKSPKWRALRWRFVRFFGLR